MEAEPSAAARGSAKKRITNACHRCQRRKMRCDGEMPTCTPCSKQNAQCEYTERRRRGPGKSKQHMQLLEERLKRLESSLEKPLPIRPSQERASDSSSSNLDDPTQPQHVHPAISGGSPSATDTRHSSQTLQESLHALDGPMDISNHGFNIQQSNPRLLSFPIIPGTPSDVNLFRAQLDTSGFQRQVFTPVHSQSLLQHFVTNALDSINVIYPLFTTESLTEIFHQQFRAGPRNCNNNPPAWAVINALIATGVQWKMEHDGWDKLMPIAWTFFKNAFSIFPELLVRGNDIASCQAMLAMALFTSGTADSRMTSSLTTSLARLVQAIGLHTKEWYEKLDPVTAEEHLRVFWIAYILDSDRGMKEGLPSTFGCGEVDLDLPPDSPHDGLGEYILSGKEETINILRYMSGLAIIQTRVSTVIYSRHTLKLDNLQLQSVVAKLNHQLEMWKSDLPLEIQPGYEGCPRSSLLEPPVLTLTLGYHTTAGRISIIANRLRQSGEDGVKAFDIPVASARATLQVMQKMPPPPFSLTWQIMHHAVYALITIVMSILQDPSGSQVQVDLSLIAGFVRVVEILITDHQCNLENFLHGCKKFEAMAQKVASSGADATSMSLHQKLCNSTDHMHIVHGLMGNIPALCAEAENVLSEVLGTDYEWNQAYGPFVPENLKSEKFNFRFGSA
ncbi:hypothetical protein NM208_g6868 [Fusarium decemcellulare]|uniref:Uncharacterized protein n=1 Tax=Fusarium decemcellulare TaxID=57161 RepID=A0ACC1SBA7_9HYPO|nr:hypothetical protein NM208_g6868 [Fusarium decemcellulare]